MIEKYEFGKIKIDGKAYSDDVIVFKHSVVKWIRAEHHNVEIADLREIPSDIRVLVIGNGHDGFMKISDEVKDYLAEKGVKLIIKKTKEACDELNSLVNKEEKVAAALHLSC